MRLQFVQPVGEFWQMGVRYSDSRSRSRFSSGRGGRVSKNVRIGGGLRLEATQRSTLCYSPDSQGLITSRVVVPFANQEEA